MAEFYVTYDREGEHFIAVVVAVERPGALQFVNREAVVATMESLGHEWQLISEVQLPADDPLIPASWLERTAEIGRHKQLPKPQGSLFGQFPVG